MAFEPNLTGQNIQDTYQRVVQTDGTKVYDGTGSLLPIEFNENNVIISGTLTAQTYIVSESITNVSSGSTIFGNSSDDLHSFTGSLHVSGGGIDINSSTGTNAYKLHGNSVLHKSSSESSHVIIGNPSFHMTASCTSLNIDSVFDVTIDSNAGIVNFADSDDISVVINTSDGNITASGIITGSGINGNSIRGDTLIANETFKLQTAGGLDVTVMDFVGNRFQFGAPNGDTYATSISGSNIHLNSLGDVICGIQGGDFILNKSATEYFRFNLDDGIADIDVADDLRLDPGGGNVYIDGNITASGNIIGTVDGGTF